ncbi:uncharacterized protein PV07_10565 [Cladophialophora immunda]|uniref:Major facilitator superfamily (MFS) profile domain-containing protein n=1 Tax=Cladophialophora immunda TaxID=569365 RepID=A0A0D2C0N1_9EURO|nr:uncharacterized protein PV07_10565 [Cladophialophora immunda]KIW24878.1 hypothetical protein PV07_10565 [Cladophialophora immunda]OQU97785.1 hypothetical protein CLAIMM_03670 [Cladophialophora immunda]
MGKIHVDENKYGHVETAIDEAAGALDNDAYARQRWWNWRIAANVTIIGMSWGLFGYDNSFLSSEMALQLFVKKYQGHGTTFTAVNLNVLTAVPMTGAALGSFISAPLQRKIGRKRTFLTAYMFFCIPGSLLQLFSPNMAAFVIGRIWNNLGISILNTACGLYLAELVPPYIRARTIGLCVASGNAVSVIAATVVWASEKLDNEQQYKIPLYVQVGFPVMLGLLTLITEESPAWYMLRDEEDKARKALTKLRKGNTKIVESELSVLRTLIAEDRARRQNIRFWEILNKANILRTLTAGACWSLCQVGGQLLVLVYSTVVLIQSGVANPFEITVIIFLMSFLGGLVGGYLMDRIGRRPVALTGFVILFLLDVAIGGLACGPLATGSQRIALAALFIVFAFFNSMSFLSLGILLPAEVPALQYREATSAWAVFFNYVTATITQFVVPQLTTAAGLGARTDLIFGGCMIFVIIAAYFYLPETKGRTLAEIDELYRLKLPMRKWKDLLEDILTGRYEWVGSMNGIQIAIQQSRWAVQVNSSDNLDPVALLSYLGNMPYRRFERVGRMEDLDEAFQVAQQAVAVAPSDHPNLASYQNNLTAKLQRRFEWKGTIDDLKEVSSLTAGFR